MLHTTQTVFSGRYARRCSVRAVGREVGAVLITGLILMSVLTILVVSAVSTTVLEERMAGNSRDRQLAFQRAEQAFTVAEATFDAPPFLPFDASKFTSSCANGLCRSTLESTDWASEVDWDTEGIPAGPDGARYVVRFTSYADGQAPGDNSNGNCDLILHVTARAPGNNPNTVVTLQTTERLRVGGCLTSF